MRTIDIEMVIVCGVMALAAALGVVMGLFVIFEATIAECNGAIVVGCYVSMSFLMWGLLLLKNYDKVIKP